MKTADDAAAAAAAVSTAASVTATSWVDDENEESCSATRTSGRTWPRHEPKCSRRTSPLLHPLHPPPPLHPLLLPRPLRPWSWMPAPPLLRILPLLPPPRQSPCVSSRWQPNTRRTNENTSAARPSGWPRSCSLARSAMAPATRIMLLADSPTLRTCRAG